MITFSQLGNYGRLGNQLFQYAATKSLAIKNNYDLLLPVFKTKNWHGQECLLDHFSIKEPQTNSLAVKHLYQEPENSTFSENFFDLPDSTDLLGFFQDLRYFEDYLETISADFKLNDNTQNIATLKFQDYQKQRRNSKIVSVHVRLGDNCVNDYYKGTLFENKHLRYYEEILDFFGPSHDFLIFTGGTRSISGQDPKDVESCRQLFSKPDYNFIFSENNSTLVDFGLMLACDHHAISSLSTFSLWVGYLAQSDQSKWGQSKKIIAPEDFYLETEKRNNILYPEAWIKI